MVTLTDTFRSDGAPLGVTAAVRLLAVGPRLWRVLDRRGRALGQLSAAGEPDDVRYRARRFHAPTGAFREVGEFCRAEDALECLRLSR